MALPLYLTHLLHMYLIEWLNWVFDLDLIETQVDQSFLKNMDLTLEFIVLLSEHSTVRGLPNVDTSLSGLGVTVGACR
jgi:hypothetical protein